MRAVEKIATCQISFIPIGSGDYIREINEVIELIKNFGLEHEVGMLSTVARGGKSKVLEMINSIYNKMDERCNFTMDVKISNICGCD